MPSNKPRVATYTTEKNIRKLKVISAYCNMSMSEYMEFLIDKAIGEYERENGEIKLSGASINIDFLKENSDRMKFRSKAGGKEE